MDMVTWNDMWWRIAIAPWLESAAVRFRGIIDRYETEPDEYYFEEAARECAWNCSPDLNDDIAGLAELNPDVWTTANEYDLGTGIDIYYVLRIAVSQLMWRELMSLIPDEKVFA